MNNAPEELKRIIAGMKKEQDGVLSSRAIRWVAKNFVLAEPAVRIYVMLRPDMTLEAIRNRTQMVTLYEYLFEDYDTETVFKAMVKAKKLPESQLAHNSSSKKMAHDFVLQLSNRDDRKKTKR